MNACVETSFFVGACRRELLYLYLLNRAFRTDLYGEHVAARGELCGIEPERSACKTVAKVENGLALHTEYLRIRDTAIKCHRYSHTARIHDSFPDNR